MATFKIAQPYVHDLTSKVLRECFPQLFELTKEHTNPLTFDLLMVHADLDANGEPVGPAIRHHGCAADAVIKAVPKADRALGRADVEVRFDGDRWEKMEDDHREALIDHELYHLALVTQDGLPKRDDLGRLRFRMRGHDYEFGWFTEVAKRRGLASGEVQQANRMMAQDGQVLFAFAEMPAIQKEMPIATTSSKRATPAPGLRVLEGDGEPTADGQWCLWEGMSVEQRQQALSTWGTELDRTQQFWLDANGQATAHRPIAESLGDDKAALAQETDAMAAGRRKRGSRAASKSGKKK